ncbi:hypothetical protein [Tumebacillus permanentifrigoris]|uniref:hypothetical protein n=1 Tax=Tumebacillus permanentifrigoris TaxID=378543 RepID=UPI0011B1D13C|nr:hypothetical protein [Tumebacillus permanentifrigoris]
MSKRKPLDRDLYPEVEWVEETDLKKQTAILELTSSDSPAPWVLSTVITNRIRRAISLPFPDASGLRRHPSRCYQLNLPHNQSGHIEAVISEKTFCAVYAHPC